MIEDHPARLEGEAESQWLDFKKEPHLKPDGNTQDSHRFELAKDVTAMANAGGGLIVWGFTETADRDEATKRVGELSAIPAGVVDEGQVRKVLREWVFPTWLQARILGRPVEGGSVWVLDIPPPPANQLPFLVVKEWPNEGKKPVRGHFTMYRRSGTDNAHVPPEEMYQWVYAGYQGPGGGGGGPAAVEDGPIKGSGAGTLPSVQVSGLGAVIPTSANEALDEELEALGVQEGEAYYFLQFAPNGKGRLRDFFGQSGNALQTRLGAVDTIRPQGFSCFSRYASPERTPSNGLRLGLKSKGGVYVLPTGLTTYACCQDTLTWASDKHAPEGKLLINPVALPEFTVEACLFFIREVVARWEVTGSEGGYQWRMGMSGLGGPVTVHLPRGMLGEVPLRMLWDHDGPNTATDFVSDFIRSTVDDGAQLAFVILEELFHRFGYPPQAIPFQKDGQVDIEAIRSL